ncbi:MAG: hypothetical protein D6820_01130 [Lentisphaerae bacterium]|nr:MAG: hypothetical protein D6820_01130 [Lentisphaerota bacterium]
MPAAISELFREHLDEIRNRLQEGPLPLSEALEKGWLYVDDGCEGLSKMVGVYNCPDAFGFGEAKLHVCKTNRRLNHSFRSGKTVHGEDIQLMIVRGQ